MNDAQIKKWKEAGTRARSQRAKEKWDKIITPELVKQCEIMYCERLMSPQEISDYFGLFSAISFKRKIYSRFDPTRKEAAWKTRKRAGLSSKLSVMYQQGQLDNFVAHNNPEVICRCGSIFKSKRYNLCPECREIEFWSDKHFGQDYVVCPYCDTKLVLLEDRHLKACSGKSKQDLKKDFPNCLTHSLFFTRNLQIPQRAAYADTNYRSLNEVRIAKILDRIGIGYVYEDKKTRVFYYDTEVEKTREYIPDFHIPSLNLILEAKEDVQILSSQVQAKKEASLLAGYFYVLVLNSKIEYDYISNLLGYMRGFYDRTMPPSFNG